MNSFDKLKVLVRLSLRSLWSHKVKSLIVGGILAFGTFLLVLNTTFLNNITHEMEKAVTGSLIGNAQVLSDKAKDDLSFFGGFGQQQEIGHIDDFPKVRDALMTIPNVKAVVPMGRDAAGAEGGNILDEKLDSLRQAVAAHDAVKIQGLEARIRQLAGLLEQENENRKEISSNVTEIDQHLAITRRAMSDTFWADFAKAPLPALDWLDTNLAPLQADAAQLFLNYVGTDLDLFAKEFSTFEIVQGQMVPKGHRGILLSKEFYEKQAKNMIARELDAIRDARDKDHKTIAHDNALQEKVAKIQRESRRLTYEMDPDQSIACEKDLRADLGTPKGDLASLLKKLLHVDDNDFDARYQLFYKDVAPRIQLYSFRVGDTLTLQAFSKSGYSHAQNVKVYGIFHFRGLDDSLLASAYNLMDMMTFRDLYGLMTPEKLKELAAIKKNVGVKDVSEKNAEEELFGDGEAGLVTDTKPTQIKEDDTKPLEREHASTEKAFTQEDIDHGVVLNAAVLLKDGTKLKETMAEITALSAKDKLGLKVVDWRSAAGIIGQLILVLTIVLVVSFIVIFITALAIINNSMLMSMMDRIIEIGTMRAIGAHRRFVLAMFLLESALLSTTAVVVGVLAATGTAMLLSAKGWPAAGTNPILLVLFGGPHMHPHVTASAVIVGAVCIALVSFVATLYPALIATRVQPVVAMQRRE